MRDYYFKFLLGKGMYLGMKSFEPKKHLYTKYRALECKEILFSPGPHVSIVGMYDLPPIRVRIIKGDELDKCRFANTRGRHVM